MLVSVAQDQETPAVSPVRRSLRICGRYCGIPKTAAAIGRKSSMAQDYG
jgi:hypothetical protein